MEDQTIKTFHNENLIDLLNTMGVYEGVVKGSYTCSYCGRIITPENLDSFIPINNELGFCCTSEKCRENIKEMK